MSTPKSPNTNPLTVESYDLYDNGYTTGNQISVFVGPIWVEQVVSLQLRTASQKEPVYAYSSPYYDRLLVGNYSIVGTLGVAYNEPDYLMRCLAMAQAGMSDLEMKALIEKQKGRFSMRLKDQLFNTQSSSDELRYYQKVLANAERAAYFANKNDTRYANYDQSVVMNDIRARLRDDILGQSFQVEYEKNGVIVTVPYQTVYGEVKKLLRSVNDSIYAKQVDSYVNRVSREIEMMSYVDLKTQGNLTTKSPYTFKLMIVKGNISDPKAAIEIYEDVEILGTSQVAAADDTPHIVVYDIMGRKKPDIVSTQHAYASEQNVSLLDILKIAQNLTEQLIDEILQGPEIRVFNPTARTSLMDAAHKIAPAGYLPAKLRFYDDSSASASYNELVYSFAFPVAFNYKAQEYTPMPIRYKEENDTSGIVSLTHYNGSGMNIRVTGDNISEYNKYIKKTNNTYPYKSDDGNCYVNGYGLRFENNRGQIVSVDRELTSSFCYAVAPIIPYNPWKKRGGTIAVPRYYKETNYTEGSLVPPQVIDIESMSLPTIDESLLEDFTHSTLWCQPLGFRSSVSPTTRKISGSQVISDDVNAQAGTKDYLREIVQPVSSLALIEDMKAFWQDAGDGKTAFGFQIPEPRYIDYVKLKSDPVSSAAKKKPDFQVTQERQARHMETQQEDNCVYGTLTDRIAFCWKRGEASSSGMSSSCYMPTNGNKSAELIGTQFKYRKDAKATSTVYNPSDDESDTFDDVLSERSNAVKSDADLSASFVVDMDTIYIDYAKAAEKPDAHFKTIAMKLYTDNGAVSDVARRMNLHRCIWLRPVIVPADIRITDYDPNPSGNPTNPDSIPNCKMSDETFGAIPSSATAAEKLAYIMSNKGKGGTFAGGECDYTLKYDFAVDDTTPFNNTGSSPIEIDGVYFLIPKTTSAPSYPVTTKSGATVSVPSSNLRPQNHTEWEVNDLDTKRRIHVFWVAGIVPTKTPDAKSVSDDAKAMMEDGSESENKVAVTFDIDAQAGRRVDIYNITRCDVLKYNARAFLVNEGDGTTFGAIKQKIVNILATSYGTGDTTAYIFPHKTSMNRIAGFVGGWVCRINVREIIDTILYNKGYDNRPMREPGKVEDDKEYPVFGALGYKGLEGNLMKEYNGEPVKSRHRFAKKKDGYNIATLLRRCAPADGITQLEKTVISTVERMLKRKGTTVYENDQNKLIITFGTDTMHPSAGVVGYGLTDAGAAALDKVTASANTFAGYPKF